MADETFAELLGEQIGHAFLQRLVEGTEFLRKTPCAVRNHAMMIVQYMLDADHEVEIPAIAPPRSSFADIVEPVQLALDQERRVSGQINALAARARDEGDYQGEQFMQWFIKEQVEEVATASDLLTVVERARDNPLQAEEYLAREPIGDPDDDPTAPAAAGGAV